MAPHTLLRLLSIVDKAMVGDKCLGMLEAVGEVFPDTKYQPARYIFAAMFSLLCPNPR